MGCSKLCLQGHARLAGFGAGGLRTHQNNWERPSCVPTARHASEPCSGSCDLQAAPQYDNSSFHTHLRNYRQVRCLERMLAWRTSQIQKVGTPMGASIPCPSTNISGGLTWGAGLRHSISSTIMESPPFGSYRAKRRGVPTAGFRGGD